MSNLKKIVKVKKVSPETQTPKKLDKLTQAVIDYKQSLDEKHFKIIRDSIEDLAWKVIKSYGLCTLLPTNLQEEIAQDCYTLVLLKCVDRFDITRGAKFSTFYTWWCRSHVNGCREYWTIRKKLLNVNSLSENLGNGETSGDLESVTTNFNLNTLHNIKRNIRNGNIDNLPVYNEMVYED